MPRLPQWVWFLWLPVVLWATFDPIRWHIEYFKSPGPQFYRAIMLLLPALVIGVAGYVLWLRRYLWHYELAAIGGGALASLLLYEPRASLAVLWIVAVAYAAGAHLRDRWSLKPRGPVEDLVVSTGLGLSVTICILVVLGLLRLYYNGVILVVLAALTLLLCRRMMRLAAAVRDAQRAWTASGPGGPLSGIAICFLAIFAVTGLMMVLAPSLAYDVVKFHLPAVQHYAAGRTLTPAPLTEYSYFPQGGEILMLLGYLLAGQPAAQMLMALFFVLTAAALYSVARECGAARHSSLFGVALAVTIPFLHWTGSSAKNDLMLAFLQIAALYGYLRWRTTRNFRWIELGAFFLAMGFGVKHVALFGAFPIGLLYLHALWRQPRRWFPAARLAAIMLCVGCFWLARAYMLTGNPVHPERLSRTVETGNLRRPARFGRLERAVRVPWMVHFDGSRAFESVLPNPMGFALVLLLPAWLLYRRSGEPLRDNACLFFVLLYLLYWMSIWPILRYAIAPIALLAVLTGVRAAALFDSSGRPVKAALGVAAGYSFTIALLAVMIVEVNGPQLSYFSGKIGKREYLWHAMLAYRPLDFLQGRAHPDAWVLSIGNCADAYAPEPSRFVSLCSRSNVFAPEFVEGELMSREYEYLLLAKNDGTGPVVERLAGRLTGAPLYEDAMYLIFGVQPEISKP